MKKSLSGLRASLLLATALLTVSTLLPAQVNARAALLTADTELSDAVYKNGAIATFPQALGSSGVLVWPGAAVLQGSAAASRLLAHQLQLDGARISWQPLRIEMAQDSTLAVLAGVAALDRPATETVVAARRIGRYLAAWMRVGDRWQLAAFTLVNLIPAGEQGWDDSDGPRELPLLRSVGRAGSFVAADSAFAADAGAVGASKAFEKWAAPDATTFGGTGELNTGPAQIGATLAGNTAKWVWGAVAAGASTDGTLGWTVGQATITPANGGAPSKSKYLTLWRKMPDGSIKFIADGGNARP